MLDQTRLRRQLFGYDRVSWPAALRRGLNSVQDACFYCGGPLPRKTAAEPALPEEPARDSHRSLYSVVGHDERRDREPRARRRSVQPPKERPSALADVGGAVACAPGGPPRRTVRGTTEARWPSALARTLRTAAIYYERFAMDDLTPAWDGVQVVSTAVRPAADLIRQALRGIDEG